MWMASQGLGVDYPPHWNTFTNRNIDEKEGEPMTRLFAIGAAIMTVLLTAGSAQQRLAPGSDYFTGNWMLDAGKTIAWSGEENTTFEYVTLKTENDVQFREVEAGMGLADANGIMKHRKNRTTVKYNEFDRAKAQLTNLSVFGNNNPPMTQLKSDNALVTLKVDDWSHIVFNKTGISYLRYVTPSLKEYAFFSFNGEGRVLIHRWFTRIQKPGGPNIPEPIGRTN